MIVEELVRVFAYSIVVLSMVLGLDKFEFKFSIYRLLVCDFEYII